MSGTASPVARAVVQPVASPVVGDVGGGGGEIPVPAIATGQTLLFRETWASTPTNAIPGVWTSVTDNNGMLVAGIPGGETVLAIDGETRARNVLAVEQPTSAQISAGYQPKGMYYTLPSNRSETGDVLMVSVSIRMSSANQWNGRRVLQITDAFDNPYYEISVQKRNTTANTGYFQFIKTYVANYDTPEVSIGEWVRFYFIMEFGGALKCYYQGPDDSSPVLLANTTAHASIATARLHVLSPNPAPTNQPLFSGQMGAVSIYAVDSLANAEPGPSDFLPPESTGNTFVVDPVSGSDASILGPWQTYDAAVAAINKSIVMGTSRNFLTNAGAKADWANGWNTTQRRDFALDWENGTKGKLNPKCDVINIKEGVYRPQTAFSWLRRNLPVGIGFVSSDGIHAAELRLTEVLTDSWTQPDSGSYPNVWEYTGGDRANRVVWGPGKVELSGVFVGTTLATVLTKMQSDTTWSQWTSAAGVTYVRCPNAPSSYGLWEGSLATGIGIGDLTGAYTYGLHISGSGYVNWSESGLSDRVLAEYNYFTSPGVFTTVIENVRTSGWSKHITANVGTTDTGHIITLNGVYGPQVPSNTGGDPEIDFGVGDHSAIVDFTSDSGTSGGTAVFCHLSPQAHVTNFVAVAGSSTGRAFDNATDRLYLSHDAGTGAGQFALLLFTNLSPPNPYFFGGFDLTNPANWPDTALDLQIDP